MLFVIGEPTEFQIQLQQAIQKILPLDFQAQNVGEAIHISSIRRGGVIALPIDYATEFADGDLSRLAHVLQSQFDHLQDYVAETTGDAWPGRRVMPKPIVEIVANTIRISYQGGDADTLYLDEILI